MSADPSAETAAKYTEPQAKDFAAMTVSSTASRWTYTGNGVTAAFSYGNLIFAASDLQVFVGGALKLLTTDYSVSNVGLAAGGNVTFVEAPANGATVLIVRAVPATQAIDFVANQDLRADTLELGLDKATVLIQQILARFGRGLFLADGDAAAGLLALPLKSALAGKFLAFDAQGEPIAAVPPAEGTPVSSCDERRGGRRLGAHRRPALGSQDTLSCPEFRSGSVLFQLRTAL